MPIVERDKESESRSSTSPQDSLQCAPSNYEVLQILSQEPKTKIQPFRGEMCQKYRRSEIPVSQRGRGSKTDLSFFFSPLRWRLTSAAWCQIYHLSNGFLICLGFHLPDIVNPPFHQKLSFPFYLYSPLVHIRVIFFTFVFSCLHAAQ